MSTTDPWLSVIMPTFQGESYLREALESVGRQDKGDLLELIAVDDGSTDATLSILEDAKKRLPVRIIRHNKGNWVAGTNAGLEAAGGEFISFLHQDDIWLDGRLAELRGMRESHPDAGMLLHPSVFIGPGGERLGKWSLPFDRGCNGVVNASDVLQCLLVQNFMAIPAPCFRKDLFREAGRMK